MGEALAELGDPSSAEVSSTGIKCEVWTEEEASVPTPAQAQQNPTAAQAQQNQTEQELRRLQAE